MHTYIVRSFMHVPMSTRIIINSDKLLKMPSDLISKSLFLNFPEGTHALDPLVFLCAAYLLAIWLAIYCYALNNPCRNASLNFRTPQWNS